MSKGNRVIQFRITEEAYDLMDLARRVRNMVSANEPQDMSAWVRAAVMEKLAHLRRAREQGKVKRYRCVHCGLGRTIEEIDHVVKPMWGRKEYICTSCVTVTIPNENGHPLRDQGQG